MSGKGEKHEKTSGSKVLKKARSFREDFKGLIKRRPSNSSTHGLPAGKPKIQVNGGRVDDKDPDLQKLRTEVDSVYRSLRYIKAVIDQEKLQIVPNTATVVLDTVNDVFLILNSFFMTQDSSSLTSRHNKVCQSLAHFIKWADDLLLHGHKSMINKDNAHQLITSLTDGMEELYQICLDKWEDRRNHTSPQKSPAPRSPGPNSPSPKNNSLPDIPLTPREREILDKTSDLGIYDNPGMPVSRSADSVTMSNGGTSFEFPATDCTPPPKPPLPQNAGVIVPQLIQKSMSQDDTDGGDAPPPLPDKTKRRSQIQNMLEMVSNAGLHAGNVSPSNLSPHNSMILSGNVSFLDYSMNSSNGSLHSQGSCPSPSSSVSSGLNQSAESLMSEGNVQRSGHFSKTVSDSTLTKKSVVLKSSHSECTVNQINQLTQEIDKLTKLTDDMQAMTKQNLNQGARRSEGPPPPLPNKANRMNRMVSHYDNVPDGATIESSFSSSNAVCNRTLISQTITSRTSHRSQTSEARLSSSSTSSTQSFSGVQMQKSNTISFSQQTSSQEDAYSSSGSFSSTSHSSMDSIPRPPPLPPKMRHIQTYMQTIGAYTQPQGIESISRHSMNFYEAQWQRHQMELSHTLYPRSNTISVISDFSSDSSFGGSAPGSPSIPALPAKRRFGINRDSQLSTTSSQSDTLSDVFREKTASMVEPSNIPQHDIEQKRASAPAGQYTETPIQVEPPALPEKSDIAKDADSDFAELNPLDDIDVSDQLIYKNEGEDGPDIRGGAIDALVVHATAANKTEFMYQEAFLTTYRTYLSSRELVDKLLYRFNKFQYSPDVTRKKSARNALFLLIRVIDLMSLLELDEKMIGIMKELVFELLCQGDLTLARVLRMKLIEKVEAKKVQEVHHQEHNTPLSSISVTTNRPDLLHFKSHEIAEQMTLIDANLFQQIEIPEVLLWAKEQSEELSPNLTQFTEHFNKMSYWCRTRILLQTEAKEREKYMVKYIKIMRHLRKMNNFNSYLALLSALDSAPVRRLDWQKQHLDALKEFCQLIDSSGSFRAYRHALSETDPPCIPYIGLILQDLTFINIGNQDCLPDGSINFAKRWQQFHILDNMRRFRDKKCNYDLKRKKEIVEMFDNFADYLGEEALWQISEEIKPRGGKKKVESEL
ncbi:rap guanine nucleotide exchange factor 1-like isoform X2 [Ruditapes philippinarum]|uniref:rap guanine nucleotide exchange factor 1-like isoform X2 n=1 Tax=Ruditapes philippinarum TaxID=129788 RepID=UPI00295AA7A1|nr:rap guanine nucleotide exchange factor 1-like isoform X2 [Ruditapes philippinarum]